MRSYSYLMSANGSGNAHYVELLEDKFMELLRLAVSRVEVDEAWYRRNYRDVDQAIVAGQIASARQHYVEAGYFENRFPREIVVDEDWYLDEYADVAVAVKFGAFSSATHHFETEGFKEGRLPKYSWSLINDNVLADTISV